MKDKIPIRKVIPATSGKPIMPDSILFENGSKIEVLESKDVIRGSRFKDIEWFYETKEN